MKWYVVVLRMGAHLGQDPFGSNAFSAILCDIRALRAIEDWLRSGPMDEKTIAAVQKQVRALSEGRPRWEPLVAAELVMLDELVEQLQEEPECLDNTNFGWGLLEDLRKKIARTKPARERLRQDGPWLRGQLVERSAMPLHEYLRTLPEYDKAVRRGIPWLAPGRIVAEMCDSRFLRCWCGHDELCWTAFDVQCALLRYRAAHGEYPERLEDANALMLSGGVDPFSGQALKYRREADGSFTLWSLGEDLKDDGGKREEGKSRWQCADYVWSSAPIGEVK